ncbi:Arginase/deacetylase [Paraphaeosphaeria sporulosa]|uniref:Arginase/deacetylase n=1 Tax=Paraphaeosphaeria sporulosa TaxID=1460663 RepID=A0A177C378_9PLEO|nr:Arginase/deacetylase [Paraphaeosphaeria sporulosa]OAG01925.1 Arginase/deacetylase [Paraphaeosphaeria sporulosa]
MDNYRAASPAGSPRYRASTNNADATLLAQSLKRMSLHSGSAHPPPAQSPSAATPKRPSPPSRPSSVMSQRRSESPALGRKSSTLSLRNGAASSPVLPGSRRGSFAPNMPSSPLAPQPEQKPPPRACDIAEECFRKELARHEGMAGAANAGTIVIIHDQCYGHRYARPKTTKATLATIMERPERMLASVRGIAMAYVRLGERHIEGSNPLRPDQNAPERIPFKIRKTSRMVGLDSQVVTNVHGTKWMEELNSLCVNAGQKLASTGKELARDPPTMPGQPPKDAFHPMDLYLSSESLHALQGALGGVLDAVDAVFQGSSLDNGVSRAFVCIRPPGHHCSAEWPSGFCWLNNVHIGIEHAMMNYGLTHAAIIDFDLHHGDGSQDITWDRNKKVMGMHKNVASWKKTSIGYFSLHDINSFPCEDGDDSKVQAASLCIDNAHGQSVWNIHLETWSTVEEFWQIYEEKYLVLLDKARKYLKHHTNRLRKSPNHPTPKAAIFLSAGFDASEHETGGMQRHAVNVPTEFYARFTRDVVRLADELDTGVDGRIISVLEGGYSDRALSSGVLSHLSGLCDGQVFTDAPISSLALNMHNRMNELGVHDEDMLTSYAEPGLTPVTYDPLWWHESCLLELENLVTPPPNIIPKKVRSGPAAHFSSPTQSFTAKVVDPSRLQRSLSGRYTPSRSASPAPPLPLPEVDWATAAHTLSQMLIPADRQTRSHKFEELAEPKVKKEKPAPVLTSVHVDPSGRQLRGRKPAATLYADDDDESVRAASRASRRQTIADFPLASIEPEPKQRSVSRRMSIASSVGSTTESQITSRASSVLSNRRSAIPAPSASGVPMKKARAPSTAAAARIPKSRPPVPRVPSNYLSKTAASIDKEKENEMDQLTSRVQRVKLNMPSKEEHDAREKAKEAEKKAKATRKAPAPKTTKPSAKKAPGRPPKTAQPPSSVNQIEVSVPVAAPQASEMEVAAITPLKQQQPIVPEAVPIDMEQTHESIALREGSTKSPRQSIGMLEPPTELMEMSITPEQLPVPPFLERESLPLTTSPPRPDTPPPPPPTNMNGFVNYNTQTFGTVRPPSETQAQTALQWLPPNTAAPVPTLANIPANLNSNLSPSAAGTRNTLPVFSSSGTIPFAPRPNGVAAVPSTEPKVEPKDEPKDIWEVPETPVR